MTNLQIVLLIIIPVVSGLTLAFIFFLCRGFKKFLGSMKQAVDDIRSLKIDGEKRKRESRLNIDGMFIIMEAMKGEDINGNVNDLRVKYDSYLKEEAIQ